MKKKHIIMIEIFIWVLILCIGFYFFIYNTTLKDNSKNSCYLFFDDAGGLVKGSPVRLMGINIGYVRDVKIFDNKVFVSFLVTKDDVQMPKEADASVEFYGLGGSTSLELMPKIPTFVDDDREVIIPTGSYRIQDYWDGAKLSANVMIDIYGSIGRTIDMTGVLNHKEWLKQSKLAKEYAEITHNVNQQQTVIINKLSDLTKEYSDKKIKEASEIAGEEENE